MNGIVIHISAKVEEIIVYVEWQLWEEKYGSLETLSKLRGVELTAMHQLDMFLISFENATDHLWYRKVMLEFY